MFNKYWVSEMQKKSFPERRSLTIFFLLLSTTFCASGPRGRHAEDAVEGGAELVADLGHKQPDPLPLLRRPTRRRRQLPRLRSDRGKGKPGRGGEAV